MRGEPQARLNSVKICITKRILVVKHLVLHLDGNHARLLHLRRHIFVAPVQPMAEANQTVFSRLLVPPIQRYLNVQAGIGGDLLTCRGRAGKEIPGSTMAPVSPLPATGAGTSKLRLIRRCCCIVPIQAGFFCRPI